MNKIKWCFSIKGGLKFVEPSEDISKSYLAESENSLSKINQLIEESDFLWASVHIYYCAYYSIYSFLQRIGIKSENHDCSIELARELIKEDFLDYMDDFKKERVDAQYYLKTGQKKKMVHNYARVKEFYLQFKKIINEITEKDIREYRNKLKEILK